MRNTVENNLNDLHRLYALNRLGANALFNGIVRKWDRM